MIKKNFYDKKTLQKLLAKMKKGNILKIYFGKDDINNETIEIRDVIDNTQIIYRTENSIKNNFAYRMKDIAWFYSLKKSGCLIQLKQKSSGVAG